MDRQKQFILSHRVARMATADKLGRPLVVPICYVFDGKNLYTPIDKKPKRVSVRELKRIRNILENPKISIVIDDYYEEWNKLTYVIIHGRAELMESGEEYQRSLRLLCEKYTQYVDMNLSTLNLPVIKVIPDRILFWRAI
ncbi:MAG: TIGR03668 family PPOX class F420-dependent oxidoreductase [Deltaproteobacteria bacterium]|nr:TIGR03668 family PPOX class F420-dependent oxidoreductase [Deltaproteobacteria bacterium]